MIAGLSVFTNDTDTVIARDLADVQVIVEAHYGATFESEGWELDDWSKIPDNKDITICNLHDGGEGDRATKTAAEWIAQMGRGFLCSTEW